MEEGRCIMCDRKDCTINQSGWCWGVTRVARLKNGTVHVLDLSDCPFYKKKEKDDDEHREEFH